MQQDPNNASTLTMLQTPGGVRSLPRLRPSDVIRLKNRISSERRAKILLNAKDSGIEPTLINRQLNEFDARPIDRSQVVEWALLPEGRVPALAMSWHQTMATPPSEEERATLLLTAEREIDAWNADDRAIVTAIAGIFNVVLTSTTPAPTTGTPGNVRGEEETTASPSPITTSPEKQPE